MIEECNAGPLTMGSKWECILQMSDYRNMKESLFLTVVITRKTSLYIIRVIVCKLSSNSHSFFPPPFVLAAIGCGVKLNRNDLLRLTVTLVNFICNCEIGVLC